MIMSSVGIGRLYESLNDSVDDLALHKVGPTLYVRDDTTHVGVKTAYDVSLAHMWVRADHDKRPREQQRPQPITTSEQATSST